jgi:hypothetical protein
LSQSQIKDGKQRDVYIPYQQQHSNCLPEEFPESGSSVLSQNKHVK